MDGGAIDALLPRRIRPWASSWLGHGCSLLRTDFAMGVIMFGPYRMLFSNRLDHGRHDGWAVDALFSERTRL